MSRTRTALGPFPGGLPYGTKLPGVPIGPSGTPLWPPAPGYFKIRSTDLLYEVVMLFDEEPPARTPGGVRVETVDLPFRNQGTYVAGYDNDTLEVQVIVEGYPRRNIESVLTELEGMGRPRRIGVASGGPKPVEIAGQVDGTDQLWFPPKIQPGKAIWRDGHRVRQHLTLSFVEYDPLDRVESEKRKNQRDAKGKLKRRPNHTVRKNETLSSIAQDVLGQAKRWKDIASLNPHRSGKKKTARRSPTDVKVGESLKMPQN
jgi:hypothetical protein